MIHKRKELLFYKLKYVNFPWNIGILPFLLTSQWFNLQCEMTDALLWLWIKIIKLKLIEQYIQNFNAFNGNFMCSALNGKCIILQINWFISIVSRCVLIAHIIGYDPFYVNDAIIASASHIKLFKTDNDMTISNKAFATNQVTWNTIWIFGNFRRRMDRKYV